MSVNYDLQSFVKQVGVAARRDYVFGMGTGPQAQITNALAAGTTLNTSISLDAELPWVWFAFRIASIQNVEAGVTNKDLSLNLQDAEQRFLFTDPVRAITLGTGDFGFDPFTINPMRIFPPGGAIYMQFTNNRVSGSVAFDIIFMGYDVANSEDIRQ